MKCRLNKCHAACCHNIVFERNELERFKDKIVNPIINTEVIGPHGAVLAQTDYDFMHNKCPFLRHDCKCNIYDDRPEVCRLFGEIPQLYCEYRKKSSKVK